MADAKESEFIDGPYLDRLVFDVSAASFRCRDRAGAVKAEIETGKRLCEGHGAAINASGDGLVGREGEAS